jgi:zinc protease
MPLEPRRAARICRLPRNLNPGVRFAYTSFGRKDATARFELELPMTMRSLSLVKSTWIAGVAVSMVMSLAIMMGHPTHAHAQRLGDNVSTFTLDNGLQVVVVPDHRAPVVTHMIWYRVGAADEPPGKSGIAHFLEHLMFKGTETRPEGEFSRVIAEVGGQENAFTSADFTGYFQRVAREHLGLMMDYEADRMSNLTLTDEQVAAELQVVIEERASRVDNEPSSQLSEAVSATLYKSHPYRLPVIGWLHEIETLNREDALAFYDRFYTPNNAIVVVAGDATADEVRALAEETYGRVERRAETPPRMRPREPEPVASRDVTLVSPRVDQESVRRVWLAPSYNTAQPGEAEALDMLAGILGGGATGRLYRELVLEEQLATSTGAWYQGSALDDSQVSVFAVPRQGVALEELAAGFNRVVARMAADGPTDEEMERTRNSLIASTIFAQDSQASLARIYGTALTTGSTVEDVNSWIDRIREVTAADVAAAAERYLTDPRSVTGYLRSAPVEADAADTSG